jgi:hypothetical protein
MMLAVNCWPASQRLKLSLSCCNKKASSVKGRDICNLTGAEKSRNMDRKMQQYCISPLKSLYLLLMARLWMRLWQMRPPRIMN